MNVPIPPPHEGLDAIRETLSGYYAGAGEFDIVVHHQAESASGVVMNERLDRILANGRWIELPVMGVFELSDGKVVKWRDYFDVGQLSAQM
jgi:limonene-1,2-epoxide hydrolase